MGNFRQHITCSTVTGIVLGGVGYSFGLPLPTCLLSAGLCSIAGMFPDIDSDTSRSFQECIYLAAGIAAVLFVQRLRQLTIEPDIIMLGGGAMLLFVRFGVGELVKKTTSHRGMFHSIPAAVFAGQITYFLATGITEERIFKAFAISSGYLSHLILDEICSVDSNGHVKKSFGTALKWFDLKKKRATLILYTMVISMGVTMFNDSEFDASAKQLISDGKNMKLTDTIHEVKENFKTVIQQEAAAYLAKEKNKEKNKDTASSVTESLLPQVSVSEVDHERHLFSRRQRRIDRAPTTAAGSETSSIPSPVSSPVFPANLQNVSQNVSQTDSQTVSQNILPTINSQINSQTDTQTSFSKQEFSSHSVAQPTLPPTLPATLPPNLSATLPQSSSPNIFGTDFRNRDNYHNFSLPSREPATVILP
ncbi:MAG: metal-dependent hydrolase [Planctomycetaceae bacterium]|nr:metal-dependent hydrolase [Planctomycetaceae bacterium]